MMHHSIGHCLGILLLIIASHVQSISTWPNESSLHYRSSSGDSLNILVSAEPIGVRGFDGTLTYLDQEANGLFKRQISLGNKRKPPGSSTPAQASKQNLPAKPQTPALPLPIANKNVPQDSSRGKTANSKSLTIPASTAKVKQQKLNPSLRVSKPNTKGRGNVVPNRIRTPNYSTLKSGANGRGSRGSQSQNRLKRTPVNQLANSGTTKPGAQKNNSKSKKLCRRGDAERGTVEECASPPISELIAGWEERSRPATPRVMSPTSPRSPRSPRTPPGRRIPSGLPVVAEDAPVQGLPPGLPIGTLRGSPERRPTMTPIINPQDAPVQGIPPGSPIGTLRGLPERRPTIGTVINPQDLPPLKTTLRRGPMLYEAGPSDPSRMRRPQGWQSPNTSSPKGRQDQTPFSDAAMKSLQIDGGHKTTTSKSESKMPPSKFAPAAQRQLSTALPAHGASRQTQQPEIQEMASSRLTDNGQSSGARSMTPPGTHQAPSGGHGAPGGTTTTGTTGDTTNPSPAAQQDCIGQACTTAAKGLYKGVVDAGKGIGWALANPKQCYGKTCDIAKSAAKTISENKMNTAVLTSGSAGAFVASSAGYTGFCCPHCAPVAACALTGLGQGLFATAFGLGGYKLLSDHREKQADMDDRRNLREETITKSNSAADFSTAAHEMSTQAFKKSETAEKKTTDLEGRVGDLTGQTSNANRRADEANQKVGGIRSEFNNRLAEMRGHMDNTRAMGDINLANRLNSFEKKITDKQNSRIDKNRRKIDRHLQTHGFPPLNYQTDSGTSSPLETSDLPGLPEEPERRP